MKNWLKQAQVMELVGCTEKHLFNERKRGNLKAYKPAKELLYDPEEVEKWIKRSAVK